MMINLSTKRAAVYIACFFSKELPAKLRQVREAVYAFMAHCHVSCVHHQTRTLHLVTESDV